MNGPFLAIALLVAVLLVNWRLVLVALIACLIALVVLGVGAVRLADPNAVGLPASNEQTSSVLDTTPLAGVRPLQLR